MKIETRLFTVCLIGAVLAAGAFISYQPVPRTPHDRPLDPALRMPAAVSAFIQRSCGDCHSNGTKWPWYAHLPVASSLLKHDVEGARRVLNFSEWSAQAGLTRGRAAGLLAASCADLKSGRMPLSQYLWLHPDAKPTCTEIQVFCDWTRQTKRPANVMPVASNKRF